MKYKFEQIDSINYKHKYLNIYLTKNSNLSKVFKLIDMFIEKEPFNRKDSGTLVAAVESQCINLFEEILKFVKVNYKELKAWVVDKRCYISFNDRV